MSYRAPDTGDPELDRKLRLEDFAMLLPRLRAAADDQGFAVWLDKLALVDRESTVAYLRENWAALPRIWKRLARVRLRELGDWPLD